MNNSGHLRLGSEYAGQINDSNMMAMGPLDTGYGQFGSIKQYGESQRPANLDSVGGDGDDYSDHDSILKKRLVTQAEIDKYCKPQNLCIYNPDASGFKFKVIGLFGMPEIDLKSPSIYVTLATVIPPAGPFRMKPFNSMFASQLFSDIDFSKTMDDMQIYHHEEFVEVPGS